MNYKNVKFLPTVGLGPSPFGFLNERATTALRRLMSLSGLKFIGFYLSVLFLEIRKPVARDRCSKIIIVNYILYALYSQQTS